MTVTLYIDFTWFYAFWFVDVALLILINFLRRCLSRLYFRKLWSLLNQQWNLKVHSLPRTKSLVWCIMKSMVPDLFVDGSNSPTKIRVPKMRGNPVKQWGGRIYQILPVCEIHSWASWNTSQRGMQRDVVLPAAWVESMVIKMGCAVCFWG